MGGPRGHGWTRVREGLWQDGYTRRDVEGDHNHNGEHDNQDDEWEKKKHERWDR